MNLRVPCATGKFWQSEVQLAFQAKLRTVELDSTQYARIFPANFLLPINGHPTSCFKPLIIHGARVYMTKTDFKTNLYRRRYLVIRTVYIRFQTRNFLHKWLQVLNTV